MTRHLVVIGSACWLAAIVVFGVVWMSARDMSGYDSPSGSGRVDPKGEVSECPAGDSGGSPAAWLSRPDSLCPTARLDFGMATGREHCLPMAPGHGPEVFTWRACPREGSAQVLIRSTLGGVDRQEWLGAKWFCQDSHKVLLTDLETAPPLLADTERLTLHLHKGVWRVDGMPGRVGDAACALARVVWILRHTFATSGSIGLGEDLSMAGVPHRLWCRHERGWILVAPDETGCFPSGPYPCDHSIWNDFRCEVSGEGRWCLAERLSAEADHQGSAGFLVRRIVVHFPESVIGD